MKTDFLIVGAGFSGLVMAERLSNIRGAKCIVVDRRNHIGGNCYDEYDSHGVLVHKYGPHYFRTNSNSVHQYLSQFTEWKPTTYKVLASIDDDLWSFPINLKTFSKLAGRTSTTEDFVAYLERNRIPIANPLNSEEVIISKVGWELYEKFFKGYTIKQWSRHPKDLDASVCGRIPLRLNEDDRYFSDSFQALPKAGYTRMFENIIDRTRGVRIILGADFEEIKTEIKYKHLFFSGAIDEYYGRRFGPLPYRSLQFERLHYTSKDLRLLKRKNSPPGFYQPEMQVNYPGKEPYTRIVEIKHATGQQCAGTTIVREFPANYEPGRDAYYPVPSPASRDLLAKYEDLSARERDVTFLGRLGRYRYYNMDQIVAMTLTEFEKWI